MFDRTNPVHLQALQDEVANDPISIGYQPVENTSALLNLLNDPANNTGGETNTEEAFSGFDLMEACLTDSDEYAVVVNTTNRIHTMQTLFNMHDNLIPIRFKDELLAVFTNVDAPTIRDAIIAEATGPLSRAEVLWGDDTIITKRDWKDARDF